MIKASELRIGNWYLQNGIHCQLDESQFASFLDAVFMDGGDIEDIDPIELSHDILVKWGFELFPWGWVKKSTNDFGVRLNVSSFSYEVSGNNAVKLIYLHQLQNLYYALTGEELQYNQ